MQAARVAGVRYLLVERVLALPRLADAQLLLQPLPLQSLLLADALLFTKPLALLHTHKRSEALHAS